MKPAEIMDILEDSKQFRAQIFYPSVVVEWNTLIKDWKFTQVSLGYKVRCIDRDGGFDTISYAFIKKEFPKLGAEPSIAIVDILADVWDGDLIMELKKIEAVPFGGLHEFVKANIQDKVALSVACEVYYG